MIVAMQNVENECWVYSPEDSGKPIYVVTQNIPGDTKEKVCY
jgi:hypothetical protein